MLYPERAARSGAAQSTVSLPSGETVAGRLASEDEFTIVVLDRGSEQKRYEKSAVKFKIETHMSAHFDQLAKIHRR